MNKIKDLTYLGKEGQAFGPFSEDEVDEIKKTGKFVEYSFLWSADLGEWQPINLPPPPTGASASPRRRKLTSVAATGQSYSGTHIHVVCHDNHRIVSGKMRRPTDGGFVLESDTESVLPVFQKNQKVFISLIDESSGKGENINATILGTERESAHWHYELKWEKPAQLLKP